MIEFCKYLSVKGCTLHYNIQNYTRKLKGRINYYAPPPPEVLSHKSLILIKSPADLDIV